MAVDGSYVRFTYNIIHDSTIRTRNFKPLMISNREVIITVSLSVIDEKGLLRPDDMVEKSIFSIITI